MNADVQDCDTDTTEWRSIYILNVYIFVTHH